jgi:hypothetical protein
MGQALIHAKTSGEKNAFRLVEAGSVEASRKLKRNVEVLWGAI